MTGRGFKMIEIRPYASSSAGNTYLITDGCSPLLLDCGLPVGKLRHFAGYKLSELAGCLVTHEHLDHAKAATDLMRSGVDVYMSGGTARALKLSGHRLHIVKALQQFTLGTWTVLPFDTVHDAAEPLGFLLAANGAKVLYLTDTAYCRYRFRGLTHLMVEANYSLDALYEAVDRGSLHPGLRDRLLRTHFGLERVLDFLRANDLSAVREIHLLHLSDAHSDAEGFKRMVQGLTGKPVYIAEG